jgi:hypothetical protein
VDDFGEVEMTRWVGVGRSASADSHAAGVAAARDAVAGADVKLVLVFAAITHDLAAVQAGVLEVVGPVPLIGCTTHGEIGPGGPRDGTVMVAVLGGAGFSVGTAVAERVSGNQREAGAKVAAEARCVDDRPYQVLLLLTDGMIRDQEEILRGCYSILGAQVPLFGGAAADGWRMTGTRLMVDGKVRSDAVVAAMIGSDAPLSVSVRHGFRLVGPAMFVTSGSNGRVLTLDDRPAMDVYLDRLGAPPEAYTDAEAFVEFALSRPLGLQRRSGIEARNISTEVDLAGRSIGGGGGIDPGGLVWAMDGDEESILAAVDTVCQEAVAGLGGRQPVGMLTLSCAALRAVIGDDGIKREGARLERAVGGVPFAGFYTYGEIARVRGISGFHNQTMVVLAIA